MPEGVVVPILLKAGNADDSVVRIRVASICFRFYTSFFLILTLVKALSEETVGFRRTG